MNRSVFIFTPFFLATSISCFAASVEIKEADFMERWPFTVPSAKLECVGNAVILHAKGVTYGINGVAKSKGHKAIDPIWREDPKFMKMAEEIAKAQNSSVAEVRRAMGTPLKVDIGPIINRGLALCAK